MVVEFLTAMNQRFFLAPTRQQVLAPRSEQRVMSLVGNSDKENITALIGSNALGLQMPSMVVYNYERMQSNLVDNAPDGWGLSNSENVWMNCPCFYNILRTFFIRGQLKKE